MFNEPKREADLAAVSVLPSEEREKPYEIDDKSFEKESGVRDVNVSAMEAQHAEQVGEDLVVLQQDIDAVYDRAILLSAEEVTEILEHAWMEHHDDPNFPAPVRAKIEYFLSGDASTLENYEMLLEEMKIEAGLIRFSSPYPEVRAVVSCTDDYNMPTSTFRVWVLGTIWCGLGTFINQYFSIRQPAFVLTVNEVQLLTYPLARLMAWGLPTRTFKLWKWNATLNPGPFNEKEHMLITIMANVGTAAPYTMNIFWAQALPMFYNQEWARGFGYQIIVSLSVNLIGMGFAGMCRRFIVYPEHCIWLFSLSNVALNKSFHDTTNVVANGWKISRYRFFLITFAAMFVYYWLPGVLFQSLSYFNWINWIAPGNIALGAVMGTLGGIGLNPIGTLDWNNCFGTSSLILPFFSTFNQYIGTLLSAPIILGFWYGNVYNTGYFPMISNRIFDNQGGSYNVSKILKPNKELDHDKYKQYSQPFMASSNLVTYAAFFAAYSATVVHTIIYHRREISNGFATAYKSIRSGQQGNAAFKDYHNQAMAKYKEVPEWAYLGLTVIAVILGCVGLTVYPTNSSVSSIFFGIAICLVLVIPIGIIYSITGVEITLNVFAEFIGGLIYPENALAMNYFKTFGVITCANALTFAQDLKLAHYMKIGQRHAFAVQVYGAILSAFIACAIFNYQLGIPEVCTVNQKDHMICTGINTFFTATVFWGTLGPKRAFGAGGIYTALLYAFLVGAVLPIPFYLFYKRNPTSIFAKAHVVVILYGAINWYPYQTLANFTPGVVLAYVFQVYIKKKYLGWWSKYNYILATSFGSAIALCGIAIFIIVQNPGYGDKVNAWPVNTIYYSNCDADLGATPECSRLQFPDSGVIGPEIGSWH